MPTAGRLVAAVLFGALFWYLSGVGLPYFAAAETAVPPWFLPVNTGLGIVLGWVLAGGRAGRATWMGALSYGLTTGIAIAAVALFAHGFVRMIQLSLRMRYDGPVEAVAAVFGLMAEIALVLAQADVLVPLALGALVAGLATEWAGRNFR